MLPGAMNGTTEFISIMNNSNKVYVNENEIIENTKKAFFTSEIQKAHFDSITEFIDESNYHKLHKSPLAPLDITFDYENLAEEISEYSSFVEDWGDFTENPRRGLALVNQTGNLIKNDPINGSLHHWNSNNPHNPILESDCVNPTSVLGIPSLKNLAVFNSHWCRSNILIWEEGAKFYPHIDTLVPSPWFRLWATDSKNIKLFFAQDNYLHECPDIEQGRLYLIDTSIIHSAEAVGGDGHQLFLSCLPSAQSVIEHHLCY